MEAMKYNYAEPTYGDEEIRAVVRVLEDPSRLGAGSAVAAFESRVANEELGAPFGLMVNSGSSANLIGLAALDLPKGSEVVTPALTFGTTVAPILQLGLVPKFVDVEPGGLLGDLDAIEEAISEKTSAIVYPLLVGAVPDMVRLYGIAERTGAMLLVDSCDTLGARYAGSPIGVYADVVTTSFYATHILTAAGGGGLVAFRDVVANDYARTLSYWGRAASRLAREASYSNRLVDLARGLRYDAKLVFEEVGYNVQALELQAAFGLAQLDRLPELRSARNRNRLRLAERFFYVPPIRTYESLDAGAEPVWLAYALSVGSLDRNRIAERLETGFGVQTRPIMAGNLLRHPAFESLADPLAFPHADDVMRSGLLVGTHPGLDDDAIDAIADAFETVLGEVLADD